MKFAFFDVDNTIYNGYTANDLFPYLPKNERILKILKEYKQAVLDYQNRLIDYNTVCELILAQFSASLKDHSHQDIIKLVHKMLDEKKTILNEWVKPVIKFLKDKDFKIILVSGGPDTIVSEVAKIVKADEYYATEIKMIDFKYTGGPTELLNEVKKSELVENILNTGEENISIGFGDSTGDIPMLELVDKAFVVRNDHHKEMIDYSEKKNWVLFENSDEVIQLLQTFLKKPS